MSIHDFTAPFAKSLHAHMEAVCVEMQAYRNGRHVSIMSGYRPAYVIDPVKRLTPMEAGLKAVGEIGK